MRTRLPWAPTLLACVLFGMAGRTGAPGRGPGEAPVEALAPAPPPGFDRVSTLLLERAPGWDLAQRDAVALAIVEESERAGLDPLLVVALIEVESEFEAGAASLMGAQGLMQLRPTTARWVAEREGVVLPPEGLGDDASLNVRLGVRYLRYLLDSFRGRLDLALMAYNAGPNRLRAALRERAAVPERPALEWAPYVRAVRREYGALKLVHGESTDWTLATREPGSSFEAR